MLDFTSATAGAPLPAGYGNPNAAADFTWTGVDVWGNGATAAVNNSIYSGNGNVLIAAVGGQTISQVKFDYFTYFDSGITTSPTTNAWSLLDGSNTLFASGTLEATGGPVNTDKQDVKSFVYDLTPGLYSAVTLTFSNDTAMGFDNFSVTAVPEPETYALMLAGLGVVGFVARRRKTK